MNVWIAGDGMGLSLLFPTDWSRFQAHDPVVWWTWDIGRRIPNAWPGNIRHISALPSSLSIMTKQISGMIGLHYQNYWQSFKGFFCSKDTKKWHGNTRKWVKIDEVMHSCIPLTVICVGQGEQGSTSIWFPPSSDGALIPREQADLWRTEWNRATFDCWSPSCWR